MKTGTALKTVRTRAAIFLVGAMLLGAACLPWACSEGDRNDDLQPPPDFVPPAVLPLKKGPLHGRLGFGRGFYPLERSADGKTWHWMGARGEIRLLNEHRARRLRLVGWLPLEFLETPPTITLTIEGHPLDSFVASETILSKQYAIAADLLGAGSSALLVIETSATGRAPGDTRQLGVSIEQVGWQ